MAVSYEQLLGGESGYSFHLESLEETSFQEAGPKLETHLNATLAEIESRAKDGRIIQSFEVRNASARRTKEFDFQKVETWKQNQLKSLWKTYAENGSTGLVVLTAVTRNKLPKIFYPKSRMKNRAENYTAALTQRLLHG